MCKKRLNLIELTKKEEVSRENMFEIRGKVDCTRCKKCETSTFTERQVFNLGGGFPIVP